MMNRDWLQAFKHSLRMRDMHGKTALDHAEAGGYDLIVDCLKDAEKRWVAHANTRRTAACGTRLHDLTRRARRVV